MKKYRFIFNKLIRDKLPDIMRKRNIDVFDYVMEQEEYIQELKRKLLEEAQEVIDAKSESDIAEEIADVFEVAYALADAYGINYDQIEQARLHKKELRGGFDGKVYSTYIEMDMHNKESAYYLARPEKYPEMV